MKSILSTKKLTPSQKNLILGAGFSVVEYDAIQIEYVNFELPGNLENLIFTSKNAVNAFLNKMVKEPNESADIKGLLSLKAEQLGVQDYKCFCVGPKTEAILLENDLNVINAADNAQDLANFIVNTYKNERFIFFCGESRRAELPQIFKENNVDFEEIEVYKTRLNTKSFKQHFDATLFFSPSGVQSFITQNTLENTLAVCIGETTATEAKKHTTNYTTANATTIESVIARAVKALN
ncbi:uroporphyrinogen-III synthase [Leeuwenhoekiella sp. MAR_2009_132]|uniref:uroporphyrinogen-III synthase n=1 Tax=Leeuwenhoekiella sp. MAR_2009_132 TaxID=1392489 RepID=UPI00048A5CD3|nr:uroporphyrinogen-III synthase [Leeuwenhoekiella sp. MAR_2009_132]